MSFIRHCNPQWLGCIKESFLLIRLHPDPLHHTFHPHPWIFKRSIGQLIIFWNCILSSKKSSWIEIKNHWIVKVNLIRFLKLTIEWQCILKHKNSVLIHNCCFKVKLFCLFNFAILLSCLLFVDPARRAVSRLYIIEDKTS